MPTGSEEVSLECDEDALGEDWPDHEKEASSIPAVPVDLNRIHNPSGPQATWLGHSTFLIQVDGLTILTDPVSRTGSHPSLGRDPSVRRPSSK